MNSNSVSMKNVVKFAGAYLACAIGSGFATGQEIMQFFSAHGLMSLAGVAVTTILFAWCGGMFMKHGYEQQFKEPGEIMGFYFGPKLSRFFEILFQVFLYGVYVVMIAGAGATLSEYFGLDPMVGRVTMAAAAFFTVILGLTKLTDILGSLGTVIIVFALAVGVYSIASNVEGLKTVSSLLPTLEITKTQGGWRGSAILYPGFNAIVVMILSCSMGRFANSSKEACRGGLLGGALFGAAILAMNLGLLANLGDVFDKAVPTLVLADHIHPMVGLVFSVIICCGIYTTTVPMLWGVVRHFAQDGSRKFVLVALILSALGLVLGMTDFKALVNIIYPFSGYAGVILFGFIAWRECQTKRVKHAHREKKPIYVGVTAETTMSVN